MKILKRTVLFLLLSLLFLTALIAVSSCSKVDKGPKIIIITEDIFNEKLKNNGYGLIEEFSFSKMEKLSEKYLIGGKKYYALINIPEATVAKGRIDFKRLPVTAIANSCFNACTELRKIKIPSSVTTIYEKAFYVNPFCDIYYGGTEEKWNTYVIKYKGWCTGNYTITFGNRED